MGLATKIKEVLHSDKDTKHRTADTSKTPGAFPSDDVPRSQKHADTGALESSGSPRTDKMPGKNSSEYTYGANDSSMTDHDGVSSDSHDTAGTRGTRGTTGTTGSHDLTGSHRNKLSKDSTTAPYWGDAERTGGLEKQPRDATGSTGGRYSPTADNELNNNHHHTSSGRDGAYGAPQTHGLTGAGGSTTHNSSHIRETGREGMPHSSTTTTGGVGSTGLPHRPLDNDATRRDHKVDEYDAPTNSHGRGHGSLPGAAALANQHHREDMRDYDTQRYDGSGMGGHGAGHHGMGGGVGGMNSGRGYNDSYDNTMSPGGNNSYGQGHGGHGMGPNTMGHNGMGSNAMGGTGMGPNAMGHNGTGYNNGMGPNNNNNTMGHNGMGMTRSGVAPGMPGVGPSMLDPHSRNTSPQQAGGAMGGMGGPGAGYSGSNTGSDYSGAPLGGGSVMPRIQQHAAGMGDGHFGPGHPGAKVMHRCDHCGNDNDISKYFSKEAVYRMS